MLGQHYAGSSTHSVRVTPGEEEAPANIHLSTSIYTQLPPLKKQHITQSSKCGQCLLVQMLTEKNAEKKCKKTSERISKGRHVLEGESLGTVRVIQGLWSLSSPAAEGVFC